VHWHGTTKQSKANAEHYEIAMWLQNVEATHHSGVQAALNNKFRSKVSLIHCAQRP
jgi:hypothetical protein